MINPGKKNIRKWIEALRSGKYTQTRSILQNDNGYCCLRVGCMIFIPKRKQNLDPAGVLMYTMPQDQAYAPNWLKTVDKNFEKKTDLNLVSLNDVEKLSFDEIADCLEAVYIHEVLK